MKIIDKIRKVSKSSMLLLAMTLGITAANAQMNGSYTIDPTNASAASAKMFKNWNSFVKSLYNVSTTVNPRTDGGPIVTGNATVSGAVTVTVMSTNATAETVILNFPAVTGASSTNTITIDGNYQKFNFGTAAYAPFQFTGIDYLTIKNLTLVNASTTPGGFWFNNQSDYNTISGCTVSFSALTSVNTQVSYVSFSTSSSSSTSFGSVATGTTGQPGSFNTIDGCTFETINTNSPGPYYAISLNGNSSNYATVGQNNNFINNKITNFNYYGLYQYYTNGNIIKNNDFSRANATSTGSTTMYGVSSYYSYNTTRSTEISGNKLHDLPFAGATLSTTTMSSIYGFYVFYPYGNSTYRFKMDGNSEYNIFTTTGTCYYNYVYYPSYSDITNNELFSTQMSGTTATGYAWYIYYPSYTTVVGNSIKNVVNNYYWYGFWITYGSYIDVNKNVADNVRVNSSTGYMYNWWINYPTGVKCNGNTSNNNYCGNYMYNFWINYGSIGTYSWNEFQDNILTNNTAVNYLYSTYIYYYSGTNHFKINRNFIVGNTVTGATGYHYVYWYYLNNYQVIGNVVAGNTANSHYNYIYSGISGCTAEVRNNTFQINTTSAKTPASSYMYVYFYLYYHETRFTGNIIDLKGSGPQYYRYLYMYLSYSNIANLKEFDYNTYSLNNLFTYPYWYFNGTNYTDWAGFSGSGVNGANDNGIDPLYVNAGAQDYRPGAWGTQNNVPYLAINKIDVKNVDRNSVKHDRGGLETQTDIAMQSTNFTVPATVCAGYIAGANTYVILKSNYLYDKAKGFKVAYTINGGPKTSVAVNKAMAYGDTALIYFPKSVMLSVAGQTRIAFFVDMPDDYNVNDSIIFSTFVKPAPGGAVYTTNAAVATRAIYQPSKVNDITVLNAPVSYSVNQPRIYTNAEYKGLGAGDKWSATTAVTTPWGKTVALGTTTTFKLTDPTASSDMVVTFNTTDKSLEDSMLNLYVIIHDEGNTCDTVIKRQLLVYPTIIPNFTKPAQACLGEPVLFENKSTVNSGNMEYIWDFGTGVATDKTDAPDPVFVFTKEGTYKVKMTAKTLPYGFISEDSTTFVVNPIPAIKFSKQNACEGYDLVFNNSTTPTTGTTYAWDFGDGTNSTATAPTHKYSKQGTYNITLVATLNGCVAKSVQRAYQFEKPKAAFAKLSGDCDNKQFEFTNSSSVATAALGYFWNFDDGSFSTAVNPKHVFDGFGTKNVKLIVTTEFGCKDSVTRPISVKESPKVKFTNGPACSLKPTLFTNLTSSVPNTYAIYTWTFSDGTNSLDESPSHSWSSLGSKTASLTISLDNGCYATLTKNLDVLVQPKAAFTAQDVCAGSPMSFSNKTTWAQGEISYDWNFSDNTVSTETAPVHMYANGVTTTYNVTLVAKIAGGCSDTVTERVTVNEGPKTCDFTFAPDYGYGYFGMKFDPLDGNGKVGAQSGVKYTWVIENGGSKLGNTVQHNFVKDGLYEVTMYALINNSTCECSKTKSVIMNRASAKSFETTGVAVYPNPASKNVNIAMKENFGKVVTITMTNVSGAKVKTMTAENNGMLNMNISDLASGVYMVNVSSGSNVSVQKLIVE